MNNLIKSLKVFFVASFLLIFASCNLFVTKGSASGTGSVQILINSGSRDIMPTDVSFRPLMYTIEGTGDQGDTFSVNVHPESQSFSKDQMAIGNWTITVKAFNSTTELDDNHLIACGNVSIVILEGQSILTQVILTPAGILDPTTSGTLDIKIKIPTEGALIPIMTLDSETGGSITLSGDDLKPSNGVIHLNKPLSTGVWDLNFRLLNGEIEIAGFHEKLYISKDLISSKTISLNSINFTEDNIFLLKIIESSVPEVYLNSNIELTVKSNFSYEVAGTYEGKPLNITSSSGQFLTSSQLIEGQNVYHFLDPEYGTIIFTFDSAHKGVFDQKDNNGAIMYSGSFVLFNNENIRPDDQGELFLINNNTCLIGGNVNQILKVEDNIFTLYPNEPIESEQNELNIGAFQYEKIDNIFDPTKKAFKLTLSNNQNPRSFYFTSEYKGLVVEGDLDDPVDIQPFSFDVIEDGSIIENNYTQNLFYTIQTETETETKDYQFLNKSYTMISSSESPIDFKVSPGVTQTDSLNLISTKESYSSELTIPGCDVLGIVNNKVIIPIQLGSNAADIGSFLDISNDLPLNNKQLIYLVLDYSSKTAKAYGSTTNLFNALNENNTEPVVILSEYSELQDDFSNQYIKMTGSLNNIVYFNENSFEFINFNPKTNGFSIEGEISGVSNNWYIHRIKSIDTSNNTFSVLTTDNRDMDFVFTNSLKGVVKVTGEQGSNTYRFNFTDKTSGGYSMLNNINLSNEVNNVKTFDEYAILFNDTEVTYKIQKMDDNTLRLFEPNYIEQGTFIDSSFEILGNDKVGNPIFYISNSTLTEEILRASKYWVLEYKENPEISVIKTYDDIYTYLNGPCEESRVFTGLDLVAKFDFSPIIPDDPDVPNETCVKIEPESRTSTSFFAFWDEAKGYGDEVLQYQVELSDDNGDSFSVKIPWSRYQYGVKVDGLEPNTNYFARVSVKDRYDNIKEYNILKDARTLNNEAILYEYSVKYFFDNNEYISNAKIEDGKIIIDLPHLIDLETLAVNDIVISHGASIEPRKDETVNFKEPFSYQVTAEDRRVTPTTYEVVITEPAKITSFKLNSIDGNVDPFERKIFFRSSIIEEYPSTVMTPIIEHTGTSINPPSEEPHDFSVSNTFVLTGDNGEEFIYVVIFEGY